MSAEARSGTLEEGQVRAMFDRIARVYDLMNSVMTAGLHHRWRERAADLAALAAGARARAAEVRRGALGVGERARPAVSRRRVRRRHGRLRRAQLLRPRPRTGGDD